MIKSNNRLLKIGLIYFILMSAFIGVRVLYSFSGVISSDFYFTVMTQMLILFVLPILLIKILFKNDNIKLNYFISFKKISPKSVIVAFSIGVLLFLIGIFITTFFTALLGLLGFSYTIPLQQSGAVGLRGFIYTLIILAILPGIFEEVIHRGFLLNGLSKEIGFKYAIIFSSLLFALIHLNIMQTFHAAFIGAIFAVLVLVTSNIIPAIIAHVSYNSFVVYFLHADGGSMPGASFLSGINDFISNNSNFAIFSASFMSLFLISAGIVFLIVVLFKQNNLKRIIKFKAEIENQFNKEIFKDGYIPTEDEIKVINNVLKDNFEFDNIKKSDSDFMFLYPFLDDGKYNLKDKNLVFIYGSILLGLIITIMTFLWGIL